MALKTGPLRADLYVKDSAGNEKLILSTTGGLNNINLSTGVTETLAAASTASSLPNYGITTLSWSTAGNPAYTLAAPVAGAFKTIALQSTAVQDSTAIFSSVYSGSTATLIYDNSTAYAPKLYIGFAPPFSLVELKGLSTAAWGVVAAYGGTKFSTSATFSS